MKTPLIYAMGLDSLTARALYADLPGASIQRRRPGSHGRGSRRPDLILMDLPEADPEAEMAAAGMAWGKDVLIVGLSRNAPLARIWSHGIATLVEIGPDFLRPFLACATPAILGPMQLTRSGNL